MLNIRWNRFIPLMAAAILLITCSVPARAADGEESEARVLTVAFPNSPGISEVYEDGTFGGSVYDWAS